MHTIVPSAELSSRMQRFCQQMDNDYPDWELAVIMGRINQYYFTGTMQDGMVLIPRDGDAVFWVRKSIERARDESSFPDIRPMKSYRDAAAIHQGPYKTIHIETEVVPVALLDRFRKYFPSRGISGLDRQVARVRAVKSPYERAWMEQSGEIHRRVLEEIVPDMLTEGTNEASFLMDLYTVMVEQGHHGVSRFGMFNTEMILGQIGFGESSLYPTSFDGPGGCYGMSPAVPVMGSRERKLQKGDLVFVDIGCGVNGYHTDKTMTYMFGKPLPDEAVAIHHQCVDIQNQMAPLLKPGIAPSFIYDTIIQDLDPVFLENFMGYKERTVGFLGHGIGLVIDEIPVIARGYDEPLQEGMVLALEPKKGIPGIGMIGIENTFVVTQEGGRCLTGTNSGLIPVW
ncbi:MAG: aminopeptidase P family protein [Methanospirillaceae archaeon]|nr:aminopeptidase P family protein [Methanospirillaceae archaeon]